MARPKLAAFTHIIVLRANAPLDESPADVLRRARTTYDGPLVLGEDLMRFNRGDRVTVTDAKHEPVERD